MKITDILTEAGLSDLARGRGEPADTGEQVDNPENTNIMAQAVQDAREAFKLSKLYQNRQERPYTWAEQRDWVLHHIRNDSIHGPDDHEGAFANNFPKRYIAEYGPKSRNAATASTGGATQADVDEQTNAYEGRSSAAKAGTNQTGQKFQNTPAIDSQIQDSPDAGMASRDAYKRTSDAKQFKQVDATARKNKNRFVQRMAPVANPTPRDTAQAADVKNSRKAARNSDQHVARKEAHAAGVADGSIEQDVPASAVPAKRSLGQVRSRSGQGGNLRAPTRKNF